MTLPAGVTEVFPNEEIGLYALDELRPSPFNPRKSLDAGALRELADSIRQHGIQSPLLIRPVGGAEIGDDLTEYEIVSGHRRHAAAKLAGRFEVPCIARQMTDEEAREIALIDNLQREDVPALEEADAYAALLEQLPSKEALAARVGKPVEYVAKRLRLVALGPQSRRALAERLITVDHALLLARLGTEDEEAALKWCLDGNAGPTVKVEKVLEDRLTRRRQYAEANGGKGILGYQWEAESVLALKRHIEQSSGRKLERAPWDLDDARLVPAVGACSGCPQNTAANDLLFGDLAIAEATCADGLCFEAKRAAFVQLRLSAAGGAEEARRLSWRDSGIRPKMILGRPCEGPASLNNFTREPIRNTILKHGQWVEARQGSCPDVTTGVTLDWLDAYGAKQRKPGETLTICVTEKCKAHPKSYEKKADAGAAGGLSAAEAEARREKAVELAVAENKLRVAFVAAALETITAIPAEAIRTLVAREFAFHCDRAIEALLPGVAKIAAVAKVNSPEFARAVALAALDEDFTLDTSGFWEDVLAGRKGLIQAVRGWGYAGPDPWTKPAAKKAEAKAEAKPAAKKAPAKAAKKAAGKAAKR